VIEDAQWSDLESIAWVDHLLGRALSLPVFVLMLVRPAFWRKDPQRFSGRDHVRLELRPIARRATREIARSILGAKATDEQLDRVAEQAAGSPLFAEELARLMAAGKNAETAPTIEAAIQVSLDALDDAARSAVVRMSVLGLSVWDAGVRHLGVENDEGAFKRLVAAEIVVEQPKSRFVTTKEYLFKHALIRDVAYAMAGDGLKKQLHGRAAEWLGEVGEDAATVAQHYDLGGRFEDAARFWETAARRALATNSLADAVTMSERALAFTDDRPTAFTRAVILEEAHARLDARSSERDTAIRAMRDNVFDEASELRTDGAAARYDDARAQGADIEGRLVQVRDRATAIGLIEEAARCSATLAQRHAYGGDLARAEQEAAGLLELTESKNIVWAAVDAWQTLGVVRQTRGELAAALDARRNAARAARAAGLMEREATLTMNLGFALTTIGAKLEALFEVEAGLAKAQAIGSAFGVRHGQMILLGWAATFGAEARIEQALQEPRANADDAASGGFVQQDRTTLGVMFYRGVELLRAESSVLARARGLLERVAHSYRTTMNLDVLPVALGFWAEAERRLGDAEHAIELATEATNLLEAGAPSLLNEAPVYLALHDACVDIGDLRGARSAMEHGIPFLVRRLKGLENTPYAKSFLTSLSHNATMLAAADAYGLVPDSVNEARQYRSGS
jgi:tetratricopeptide (TPR) repeat protein